MLPKRSNPTEGKYSNLDLYSNAIQRSFGAYGTVPTGDLNTRLSSLAYAEKSHLPRRPGVYRPRDSSQLGATGQGQGNEKLSVYPTITKAYPPAPPSPPHPAIGTHTSQGPHRSSLPALPSPSINTTATSDPNIATRTRPRPATSNARLGRPSAAYSNSSQRTDPQGTNFDVTSSSLKQEGGKGHSHNVLRRRPTTAVPATSQQPTTLLSSNRSPTIESTLPGSSTSGSRRPLTASALGNHDHQRTSEANHGWEKEPMGMSRRPQTAHTTHTPMHVTWKLTQESGIGDDDDVDDKADDDEKCHVVDDGTDKGESRGLMKVIRRSTSPSSPSPLRREPTYSLLGDSTRRQAITLPPSEHIDLSAFPAPLPAVMFKWPPTLPPFPPTNLLPPPPPSSTSNSSTSTTPSKALCSTCHKLDPLASSSRQSPGTRRVQSAAVPRPRTRFSVSLLDYDYRSVCTCRATQLGSNRSSSSQNSKGQVDSPTTETKQTSSTSLSSTRTPSNNGHEKVKGSNTAISDMNDTEASAEDEARLKRALRVAFDSGSGSALVRWMLAYKGTYHNHLTNQQTGCVNDPCHFIPFLPFPLPPFPPSPPLTL